MKIALSSVVAVSVVAIGGAAFAQSNANSVWNTSEGAMELPSNPVEGQGIKAPYNQDSGRIVGTFSRMDDGRWRLVGSWVEASSNQYCETMVDGSHHWGKIEFRFDASFSTFDGRWGYCDSIPAESWTGTKSSW